MRVALTSGQPTPPKPISPLILFYAFAAVIAVGTILLLLPVANNKGGFTPFVDALFTAASAVTVTGLTVVDSSTYWSNFGQGVIVALLQIGGFGIITVSTLLFIFIGRRISLRERLTLRDVAGVNIVGGVVRLMRRIGIVILIAEAAGVLAFTIRFAFDFPLPTALWQGVFHTVSAFNNAGFVILPGDGIAAYRNDASVLLVTAVLVILGGISITVIIDALVARRWGRLSLDSKLVISMSLALWALGMLTFLIAEYSNPDTLGPLGVPGKLLNSFAESVNARTAGFAPVSVAGFQQYTLFVFMGLMFIGGVAGSTAGGIKVNTFSVIVSSVLAAIRGRPHVEAFKRELPAHQVSRALTVGVLGLGTIFLIVFSLSILEDGRFIDLLFETVSAFGTVGQSTGVTPTLTVGGRLLIALTMVVGKIGPLTLMLALAQRREPARIRYARERVRIG